MNAADIKDVMGDMPIAAHPPPIKKHKAVEKRPGKITLMVIEVPTDRPQTE